MTDYPIDGYQATLTGATFSRRGRCRQEKTKARTPMFTDNYRFTGPNTAISCGVEYDRESERYIATGGGGGWTGFSARSEQAAALNCFRAWMLDEGGYHESMIADERKKDA